MSDSVGFFKGSIALYVKAPRSVVREKTVVRVKYTNIIHYSFLKKKAISTDFFSKATCFCIFRHPVLVVAEKTVIIEFITQT